MSLTLIQRETFQGVGTLSAGAPGGLGTVLAGAAFNKRAGGPRLTADSTAQSLGWSADFRATRPQHQITLTGTAAASAGVFSCWYYVTGFSFNGNALYLTCTQGTNQVMQVKVSSSTKNFVYNRGGQYTDQDTGQAVPTNQWFELRHTWSLISGHNYNYILNFRLAGSATWTTLYSGVADSGAVIQYVYGGDGDRSGSASAFTGRYGMAALYSLTSYVADSTAALSDVTDPTGAPINWYVNPSTGAAETVNDGVSASTAFASVADFNAMAGYCGFFPRVAAAPITISSLTMSGGVATVTATAHGLSNGQTFAVAGASPAWLNSGGTVAGATANTFTFTPLFVPTPYTSASLSATGTIKIAPFAKGDVVNFDTSGATPLDAGSLQMLSKTQGVRLQPISGQSTFTVKLWKDVSGATAGGSTTWTQYNAGTYPNIWQSTDGSAADLTAVVIWEDEKWINHPTGANIAAVAVAMNTNTGGVGQFYSDGSTLYLVASDNSNPNTNGKVYTRSRYRNSGNPAIVVSGLDSQVIGLQAKKTCLANPTTGSTYVAYVVQTLSPAGGSNTLRISNCTVSYCDNHGLGFSSANTSEILLCDGCDIEQGSPYVGQGGQYPYTSYTSAASASNTHNYVNCSSLRTTGLIGSTAGTTVANKFAPAFYSHNSSGSGQLTINWISPNVQGTITCTNAVGLLNVFGGTCGGVGSGATTGFVDRTLSTYGNIAATNTGSTLTATNSIINLSLPMSGFNSGVLYGAGTIIWQGCTIDTRNSTVSDVPNNGVIYHNAALNFTMQNCVFIGNGTTTGPSLIYGATSASDTFTMDHNAYQGVSGAPIFANYNDGSTTAGRTLAQLQTLNIETSSSLSATALGLSSSYAPRRGSPVVRLGASLTSLAGNPDDAGAFRPATGSLDSGAVQLLAIGSATVCLGEAAALGFDELEMG